MPCDLIVLSRSNRNRKLFPTLKQNFSSDKNVSKHRSHLERGCNLTAIKEKKFLTFSASKIFHLECLVCWQGIPWGRLRKEEAVGRKKKKGTIKFPTWTWSHRNVHNWHDDDSLKACARTERSQLDSVQLNLGVSWDLVSLRNYAYHESTA